MAALTNDEAAVLDTGKRVARKDAAGVPGPGDLLRVQWDVSWQCKAGDHERCHAGLPKPDTYIKDLHGEVCQLIEEFEHPSRKGARAGAYARRAGMAGRPPLQMAVPVPSTLPRQPARTVQLTKGTPMRCRSIDQIRPLAEALGAELLVHLFPDTASFADQIPQTNRH
jgi:hypothetical protein